MEKIEIYIDQHINPLLRPIIMLNIEENTSRLPIICWKDYANSQGNIFKNLRKIMEYKGTFLLVICWTLHVKVNLDLLYGSSKYYFRL